MMSKNAKINVEMISFPDDNELAGLSDQFNYWKFGYPAIYYLITSLFYMGHLFILLHGLPLPAINFG